MRTRQGETFDWGYGFALPRLPSRPEEGSGEECGRVSDWGFSEISKIRRQLFLYPFGWRRTPNQLVCLAFILSKNKVGKFAPRIKVEFTIHHEFIFPFW